METQLAAALFFGGVRIASMTFIPNPDAAHAAELTRPAIQPLAYAQIACSNSRSSQPVATRNHAQLCVCSERCSGT